MERQKRRLQRAARKNVLVSEPAEEPSIQTANSIRRSG